MQFWAKSGQNWEKNEVKLLKFSGTKLSWGDRLWSKSGDGCPWGRWAKFSLSWRTPSPQEKRLTKIIKIEPYTLKYWYCNERILGLYGVFQLQLANHLIFPDNVTIYHQKESLVHLFLNSTVLILYLQKEILNELKQVCSLLGDLADQCNSLIDQYGPLVFDLLLPELVSLNLSFKNLIFQII